MPGAGVAEELNISVATMPPTPPQRRFAIAVAWVMFALFALTAPFSRIALPPLDTFIPTLEAVFCVNDLVTATLLFSQFAVIRSRGLLILATGYLFTAIIVIPHALTFPSPYSPIDGLSAGLDRNAWLYAFWHLGFPASLLFYALHKDDRHPDSAVRVSPLAEISWSIVIVTLLVAVLTWIAISGAAHLPLLFLDPTHWAPFSLYVSLFNIVIGGLALIALWNRSSSVLDQWLLIVACAFVAEQIFGCLLSPNRYSVGFYAGRTFSLATTNIVLIVLLAETTRLYTRFARLNLALERERNNKLMNLEAITASISHEVRQPLTAIVTNGSAALRFLGRQPPDLDEIRSALNAMVRDSHRASEVFESIRTLFKNDPVVRPIDMNTVALEVLRDMRTELKAHNVNVSTELTSDLPFVMGHNGQLHEVLHNLVHNAIDAMDTVGDAPRTLRITTARRGQDAIAVSVQDSGPGIDPKQIDGIFDAFVTTKSQGMGLGLAICRMIAERHGGELLALSGKYGALFQLVLPINLRNS
jgi:signal transduction histidine kinase